MGGSILTAPFAVEAQLLTKTARIGEAGARAHGVQLIFMDIRRSDDLEEAFSAMMKARVSALLVAPMVILFEARTRII